MYICEAALKKLYKTGERFSIDLGFSANQDLIYVAHVTFSRAACRTSLLLLRALVSLIAEEYRFPCSLLFQAHMQARYVILRVLLEAGEKLVQLTSVTGSDGKPDVLISLDRTKIESVGRPAIGNFLRKLQVYHHLCDLGFL